MASVFTEVKDGGSELTANVSLQDMRICCSSCDHHIPSRRLSVPAFDTPALPLPIRRITVVASSIRFEPLVRCGKWRKVDVSEEEKPWFLGGKVEIRSIYPPPIFTVYMYMYAMEIIERVLLDSPDLNVVLTFLREKITKLLQTPIEDVRMCPAAVAGDSIVHVGLSQNYLSDFFAKSIYKVASLQYCPLQTLEHACGNNISSLALQQLDYLRIIGDQTVDPESKAEQESSGWSSSITAAVKRFTKNLLTPRPSLYTQRRFKLPLVTVLFLAALLSSMQVCTVDLTAASISHSDTLRGVWNNNEQIFTAKLWGSPNTGYCVEITIGVERDQEFCVLVDTGSANLAIAGRDDHDIDEWFHTDQSSSYEDLGESVTVSYTAGEWTGRLSRDLISIDGAEQVNAYVVVISEASNFYIDNADWVGIMGLAYRTLAKPDSSILTYWDTFRDSNGLQDVFSLQLCQPLDIPLVDITEPQNGWMDLGGINQTRFHGNIFYTGIVQEKFYNVLVTNLTVGNTAIDLDCSEFNTDQSIVDSGTTDIFLPEKVFKAVRATFIDYFKDGLPLVVPEEFWTGGRKLAWPADDKHTIYRAFPTFYVGFATSQNNSEEFSLAVTSQIYLRQVEGTSDEQALTNCYPECDFFTFGIKQREKGTVIGGNVMLGFYTIFDRVKNRVGFAESTCIFQDEEKEALPHIVGPYTREPVNCECKDCEPEQPPWEIISYVCGGIVIPLAVLSVIIAVISRVRHSDCVIHSKCCCKHRQDHVLLSEEDETGNPNSSCCWWCCKKCRTNKFDIEEAMAMEGEYTSTGTHATDSGSATPPPEHSVTIEFHQTSPEPPTLAVPAVIDENNCEGDSEDVTDCTQYQEMESTSALSSSGHEEYKHEQLSKLEGTLGKLPNHSGVSYQEQTREREDFRTVHKQGRVETGSSKKHKQPYGWTTMQPDIFIQHVDDIKEREESPEQDNNDSLNLCDIEPRQTSVCSSIETQTWERQESHLLSLDRGVTKENPQLAATRADIDDEKSFICRQESTVSYAESERGQGCYSRQGSNCSRQNSSKD